ncbi:MAG: YoaK family protein [Thomasclavelia sp.]|nr:YoaK family protein [Thomasclavelia sp.]
MEKKEYLECEKWYVFATLILIGGFFGGYTYTLKGGIFCNAQTANVVLLGMNIGLGKINEALYLLIPITAYFLGTMLSEVIALKVKKFEILRWDTILIGIEIIMVIILGLLPDSVPNHIFQISINFICAMQFNTFRQNQGVPMATTFITNHIRQTGSFLVRWFRKKEKKEYLNRSLSHFYMIICFLIGAIISTFFCAHLGNQGILVACLPLGLLFIDLLHADLVVEKDKIHEVPKGH